jgi:hypothetical protein
MNKIKVCVIWTISSRPSLFGCFRWLLGDRGNYYGGQSLRATLTRGGCIFHESLRLSFPAWTRLLKIVINHTPSTQGEKITVAWVVRCFKYEFYGRQEWLSGCESIFQCLVLQMCVCQILFWRFFSWICNVTFKKIIFFWVMCYAMHDYHVKYVIWFRKCCYLALFFLFWPSVKFLVYPQDLVNLIAFYPSSSPFSCVKDVCQDEKKINQANKHTHKQTKIQPKPGDLWSNIHVTSYKMHSTL